MDPDLERQFQSGRPPAGGETMPSAEHDARVLEAARKAALRLRARTGRRRWPVPLALAAGILLGVTVPAAMRRATERAPGALTIPARGVERGSQSTARAIPVEQARPEEWYRYIQELIWAGDLEEAELHLRRFVELHPRYRPGRGE